jgi:hypothetical protein
MVQPKWVPVRSLPTACGSVAPRPRSVLPRGPDVAGSVALSRTGGPGRVVLSMWEPAGSVPTAVLPATRVTDL